MNQSLLFDMVQDELGAIEEELASVVQSQVALVTEIGSHLLKAGGKRLRPALYILCAKSGQPLMGRLLPVAVAIELIHMATLVHDDVIDESPTRRGLATANARWGNHTSVLAGDYLFAKAFSLVAANSDNSTLNVLTESICAMCEGEIVQARDIFNPAQTEADYYRRIGQKTAEFIAASCKLGAVAAELGPAEIRALRQYGHMLGMAFQITDDILDYTGVLQQTGKPAGNDLQQGVVTLPAIYALDNSPHRGELAALIAARDMTAGNLEKCLAIVQEAGGVKYARRQAETYLSTASCQLPESLPNEVHQALVQVADFVRLRKN